MKRKLVVDTLTTIPADCVDETPKGSDGGGDIKLSGLYSAPRPSYSEDNLNAISQHIQNEMIEITEETPLQTIETRENVEEL